MGARGREFVAANEPTVVAKPPLDPIIVENSQGDGRLANPPSAGENDRSKAFDEINYLLDQFVTSEEDP